MDSNPVCMTPVLDDAARKRSYKRREKVEELIKTEEGYVADLKALSNVRSIHKVDYPVSLMCSQAFFNILLPQAALSPQAKSALQTNLADLLQLHDELLRELHAAVPAKDSQPANTPIKARRPPHLRYKSADAVSEIVPFRSSLLPIRPNRRSLNLSRSSEQESMGLRLSPQAAADVSKIFLSKVSQAPFHDDLSSHQADTKVLCL